jgi:hypothetical protein
VQVDTMAQWFARGQEPTLERAPTFNGVNFSERVVVTADTPLGADGMNPPPVEWVPFFEAKWCAEFTNLPNC